MTFAAVGSLIQSNTNFTLTPHAVGDLILIEVINASSATTKATALSSSNVTWSVIGTSVTGSTNACTSQVFQGKVTAASAALVTVTWSSGVPSTVRIAGQEFSSTVGSWALDVQGHLDGSGTNTWPSLTPGAGAGELYFGFSLDSGSATAGSTSGYTYDIDSHSNGMAYNPACPNSATGPVWNDGGHYFGIMLLVKETGGVTVSPIAPRGVARGAPAIARGRGAGHQGAAYVFFPSPFQLPRRPARGAPGAARGRTEHVTGKRTPPAPPSPFTLPVRPAKGAPAIRGRGAGHQGAAYVAFPSPFQLPRRPARGAPGAARGRGGGRLGQYVTPPPPPATAPFTLPRRPARGAAAIARGRGGAGSATGAGAPVTPRPLIIALASKAGTDDYGNTFPQGILASAGIIAGPEFLVYNGAPGAGTLATSSVESAGPDAYGNAVLAGVTSYYEPSPGNWTAVSMNQGQIGIYTAASSAGPWTLQASMGWNFAGLALEVNSALEVNGSSSFNSGATFETGITVGDGISGANVNLSPPMGVISGYPFATGSFTSALAAGVNQLIGEMVNRGMIA